MKLAILKIGKALTSYAEQESSSYSHISGSSSSSSRVLDIEKYLLRGAQWLVLGLMSFRCNDRADEMIEELSNIKKLLFEKIAPKKSCLESLEYLSQFLFLFHHFDVRCCGEKLRKLMSNSYRDFLNTATLYLEHKVDSCIQGSMIQEKKETLSHLQGLSEPIERLSFIDDLQVESSTNEITAEEFRKFVEISRGTALALHVLHESNVNFSKIKVDTNLETDSKVESALYLLDNINDVKKYTKDSLKIFCKLKLLEGKILKVLLSNDELAKDCFREIVDISITQDYSKQLWFNEALGLYHELRSKKDKEIEEVVQKERGPLLEELKTEMELLESSEGFGLTKFIDFLFEKFPIKHKKVVKKPEVVRGCEKKACIMLSALYHPDKVNMETHGEKYKVMCEEISKKINRRLGYMKGVDYW